MKLTEQLVVVHKVAARYWESPSAADENALKGITVIKHTAGKIMGFFPAIEGHQEAFFKVYFYERGFNFESAGLRAANAMPKIEGVSVPKLVAIFPEYKAILTEKEDWEEERSDLQRFFVSSLGIDWFRIGRWLRSFQDSQVSLEKNDYFLRKKFEKIESHLKNLRDMFSDDQMRKMHRIIEDARDYFQSAEVEWVISHGDFGLANIQKKGEDLVIIDFEDCQMAPRAFDVLNCFIRLGYLEFFPHRRNTYQKIINQFLEGYNLKLVETPGYDFLHLLIELDLVETYTRRKQRSILERGIFLYFKAQLRKRIENWVDTVS